MAGSGDTCQACAILVLNWNGLSHLRLLLPTLQAAAARYSAGARIVVVDNRSTEPDVEAVRREFPDVEVVVAARNDFLFSLNPVVAARPEPVVIILNNDMRVDPGFIEPLLRHFGDPNLFGVTASVYDWGGTSLTTGQRRIAHRGAWFYQSWDRAVDRPAHTLDAGGGCAAFRRSYFVALGGFDRLYHPAYYEDVDLSYQAWARGWRTIFEPSSIIYHRVGATLATPGREAQTRCLLARNHALCVLKNMGGWGMAAKVLALMPVRIAKAWARGDRDGARGLLAALPRCPAALLRRFGRPRAKLSGAEIDSAVEASVAPGAATIRPAAGPAIAVAV
jgi:GT2 family glycosyltransferase